jgi:hypothetical protein
MNEEKNMEIVVIVNEKFNKAVANTIYIYV